MLTTRQVHAQLHGAAHAGEDQDAAYTHGQVLKTSVAPPTKGPRAAPHTNGCPRTKGVLEASSFAYTQHMKPSASKLCMGTMFRAAVS